MGLRLFSSSSYDTPPAVQPAANPDPANFEIVREQNFDTYCVAEVRYPDATNYEGRKIMVLPVPTVAEAVKRNGGVLDPHFSKSPAHVSPVARFEPNGRGWMLACGTATYLKDHYF